MISRFLMSGILNNLGGGSGARMPQVTVRLKECFFDREIVQMAMDKKTHKVLRVFGALVRKTARWSIKRKKSPSLPGQPPRNVTGLLKNFIWFSYDRDKQSVVIGPAKLDKRHDVPHVLEYGGAAYSTTKRTMYKFSARPYMNPAFEKIQKSHLPKLWEESIYK